ncbi:MAG: response regulator, partial [Desulfobacterales bacterium]
EDDKNIQRLLRINFSQEGFQIFQAFDGIQGLNKTEEIKPDLIILDINLPKLNGVEVCKRLKGNKETRHIPVIMLTVKKDEIDKVIGFEIGADDYVTKPFSPRELSARVKAVLRRTRRPPEVPSHDPPFRIDESKRTILYFGTSLDLSCYEYNILKIFIRRPGHVYSRDQLMDLAWDEPEASMDRAVDAHIKNIRAKLKGINPEIDPIITRRGVGYALKEDL